MRPEASCRRDSVALRLNGCKQNVSVDVSDDEHVAFWLWSFRGPVRHVRDVDEVVVKQQLNYARAHKANLERMKEPVGRSLGKCRS
jgi:hypothetical protein